MNDLVYIIVLNYSNYKDTIECVESLLSLTYDNYRIIIVDNASIDESCKKIEKYIQGNEKINLIPAKNNNGFATGNNIGIRAALRDSKAQYIWILNNDTTVDKNSLSELVKKMKSNNQIGICGSKVYYYDDPKSIQCCGGCYYNSYIGMAKEKKSDKEKKEIDYVMGCSMFFSRIFLERIGLFCEEYFLYYEEMDLSCRNNNLFRLCYAPKSIVYHKDGGSTRKGKYNPSMISDYFLLRNRLYFTIKYFPSRIVTIILSMIFAVFNRIMRKQFSHAIMIFKLIFGIKNKKFEALVKER